MSQHEGAPGSPQTTASALATPLQHKHCPLCGGENLCAPAQTGSFAVDCWCKSIGVSTEARARAAQRGDSQSCLCLRCATTP